MQCSPNTVHLPPSYVYKHSTQHSFSNTISPQPLLSMRQASYPFKTTGKHALFVFQFIMSLD